MFFSRMLFETAITASLQTKKARLYTGPAVFSRSFVSCAYGKT
jgi:hypothetical protein